MTRPRIIFNADDFGASTGVNRGIVECHRHGVLTSTSMMVTGASVEEAVALSDENPELAIGLHWDVIGEDEREFDMGDERAIRDEFEQQLDRFVALLGRAPTHVDSHRHLHRQAFELFEELVEPLGVPLREDGQVAFVGDFYAQWEWGVTDLAHVSVPALQRLLREKAGAGWTEFSCHPGYRSPDYSAMYLVEREAEIETLTDPRIPETISELGLELCSFADHARAAA